MAAASPAEAWLASLDPIGWRFGLERIEALLAELGNPQRAFASAHVVGTNGKSSVTTVCAALLEAHGRSAGAYLSPHTARWSERVLIRGVEIRPDAFARAAAAAREATATVERHLAPEDRITQFEAATATAFVALAQAEVELAVIEAGLGGRLDATNVLDSLATALVSVGRDHTQWLGETTLEIAAEKLAVLRPGTKLVVGPLQPEVLDLARRTAAERGAELVLAPEAESGVPGSADAPYLHRNVGVAIELARALLGKLDGAAVELALAGLRLPGRSERLEGNPPLILDAAHNPDGATALAEALGPHAARSPIVACLAILADKDAEGIVRALAPVLSEVACCEIPPSDIEGSGRPGSASVPGRELAAICARHGLLAEVFSGPEPAIEHAVTRARQLRGTALLAGSHYLLGYRWIAKRALSCSR